MDTHRKEWNQRQKTLRQRLSHPEDHSQVIELFLIQHAMVHAAQMAQAELWSFEDEALEGLTDQNMRLTPSGCNHSMVWVLWHLTRIEDVTMSLLAADSPQLFQEEDWARRMKVDLRTTGNDMEDESMAALNRAIDIAALRTYRLSVGRRTREIARLLQPEKLHQKVAPASLDQVREAGAVLPESSNLLDYWGGLTIAGLLLMPPTRHPFIHWNEALRIKKKIPL
jgi:hypothetical protein